MPATALRRKRLRTMAIATSACVVLALSQATNIFQFYQFSQHRAWLFCLAMTLPAWLVVSTSTPLLTGLARRFSFARGTRVQSTLVQIAAGLTFALVHVTLIGTTYSLLVEPPNWPRFVKSFWVSFHYLFYQDVLAYAAIAGIYLAIHYSDLRVQLAEARLTALRAQLNPHFLFNTLNAVSALALKGNRDEVTDMLGRLGDLLRATLDRQAQEVPLSMEMSFVDDYIAIQRVRFADRLRVERAIDPEALSGMVPSLLLQPIVENAVEHGIGRLHGSGAALSIRAARDNGSLRIEVEDTGPGFPDDQRVEGIGLANTRQRLRELYGTDCRFEYGNLPAGGAAVRILIPFRTS